ncbi:50S ribosomal protein L18 [Halobacteriovorax marinus]|uniref:Large ribosomal subunit protein uL18 n=1 Tax=Halobacteriovorax marinus (strain ATCC BAA-682 / DSM 15412 / SJ) TaxID=862908 RepID=E1X0K6_HALMS|nr:50S ribosomal protein L18 [Halobacteriovorax marinus]ATH09292.1 50S ribosomal protein L18 [Halobacteriovorax marinus]CBW28032.1 50S ribosomal protein L18 [Halobacteriovorax marinus SJ]
MRKQNGKIINAAQSRRYRRKLAIRSKINGSADRPRICVFRSNKNLSVQVIDDNAQQTLFSVQTYGKDAVGAGSNKEAAKTVGAKVAEGLKGKNITTAVFDRSGYKYHGVIATLADSVRENGIQI